MMIRWILALWLFSNLAFAQKFQFPVDCELSKDCYVQLYVDNGSGEQIADFKGGYLTNDKHTGTDIAIATYEDMDDGVAVFAAADGIVLGTRDGEDDHYSREYEFDEGKACGNGLLIRHSAEWTTQYCHMKKGSIKIKQGAAVKAGDKLGLVGSSGRADFPHLHFTIRHYGKVVDPFPGNLWEKPFPYVPFGAIDMGVTNHRISVSDVINRAPNQNKFTLKDEVVMAWIRVYGVEEDDLLRFKFYTPKGDIFGSPSAVRIDSHYKEWFSAAGFKVTEKLLRALKGQWKVVYEYKRGDDDWKSLGQLEFFVDQKN